MTAALALAAGTQAQTAAVKIVAPDGKTTYTDRPLPDAVGRIVPMGTAGAAAAAAADAAPELALPFALRQVVARFPVTLYTTPDCEPCARGRELLRQRGTPFRERQAATEADRAAWAGVVGGPQAPALAVGGQFLHGFGAESWHEALDLAGYARDVRLPPNYQPPLPQPLVAAAPRAAPASPSPPPPLAAEAPFTPASGIRF